MSIPEGGVGYCNRSLSAKVGRESLWAKLQQSLARSGRRWLR
jgi:hypothetical protein